MDHEQPFRIVLIVGSLILFPTIAYHRLKSQATGENLDRRQEGRFILFTLRPVGLASILGFVTYLVNPSWMAWSSVPLPSWLRWTGVGLGAVAGGFLIWTVHVLGKNLTDTVVTRSKHTLVTSGPYRWVRHPFYDAAAFCVLANSLATANWFIFFTGMLAFLLIVVRTRKEEENLLGRFGEAYRAYVQRTGRFLPKART